MINGTVFFLLFISKKPLKGYAQHPGAEKFKSKLF